MKKLLLLAVLFLLSACVSKQVVLHNADGQAYNCRASGFGVIGSLYASSIYDDCVATAAAKGFK